MYPSMMVGKRHVFSSNYYSVCGGVSSMASSLEKKKSSDVKMTVAWHERVWLKPNVENEEKKRRMTTEE